jgi:hypothetical protein
MGWESAHASHVIEDVAVMLNDKATIMTVNKGRVFSGDICPDAANASLFLPHVNYFAHRLALRF